MVVSYQGLLSHFNPSMFSESAKFQQDQSSLDLDMNIRNDLEKFLTFLKKVDFFLVP
jgi:hypothetical protein